MHIIFTTPEKKVLQKADLPDGTTLVQCRNDDNETPMYRWSITGGKWIKTKDFVENSRDWRKGEEEEFRKSLNKEKVLDYFIQHRDDGPQREYSVMSDLQYQYFQYIRSSGSYHHNEDYTEFQSLFTIWLNRNSDIDAAEKEISYTLEQIAKHNTYWNTIYINIMEHTLSAHAVYTVEWNKKKTFRLMRTRYGNEEELKKFTSLRSLLEYIAANHYYQKSEDSWDDDPEDDYYPIGDEY